MFAILRTKRIKDNDKFAKLCQHNLREFVNKEENIDTSKSHLNEILVDKFDLQSIKEFGGSYSGKLDDYYNKLGVKQRKNSVKCMEFMLSASPEFFEKATQSEKKEWVKHQIDFARKEFGKNLKFAVLHNDESTQHIHLVVTSEETKIIKFKNRYGEGEKETTTLNAKRFNRSYLIDLHTRYAVHNERFGLVRGVRGSKATHTDLKEFRQDVKDALNSDYKDVINKKIDKIFGGSSFGFPKKFTADEIKSGLSNFINEIVKKQKSLKTKVKKTGVAISKDVEALEQERKALETERKQLEDIKKDYFNGVNTYASTQRELAELKEELKRWKPEENTPKNEVPEATQEPTIEKPKFRFK